jgi:hypothetical protein
MDRISFEVHAKNWLNALKQCDFAGEIDVSEETLEVVAPFISSGFESNVPSDLHHAARIIFAVNCAYYADEGFWDYFCRLIHQGNDPASQTRFGRQIEESLMRFQFLIQPRYGPFRCVGPVLEQTGITRRSIPNFAEVLQECRGSAWDDILTLSYHQFVYKVEGHQAGTYLGLFLKNDNKSGWEFTRSVARSLSQLESQRISWGGLQALPGYRPGFWKELKTHIDLVSGNAGRNQRLSAPLPRLVFDPGQAQVLIRFDHDWVERRAYIFDRDAIQNSEWPLTERNDFKRRYFGQIHIVGQSSKDWEIIGWPIGPSCPVAIFHSQRGYIPLDVAVPNGLCFLLAPAGTSMPPTIKVLTDFEFVNISDAAYQFWQIEVSQDTDLTHFGYTQRQVGTNVISWSDEGERIPASIESSGVFLGQLPRLVIKNAGLFRQNRLALFLESGSKAQRIEIPGEEDTAEIALPISPPAAGQVIVEPLGRLREGDSAYAECKLEFTVLPKFPCSWPTGLHSPDNCPPISISALAPLSVEFPECEQTAPGIWIAPKGSRFAEGVLHVPPRTIRLAWPIYRAGFCREQVSQQRCFDVSEFDVDFQIRIAGLPSMPIWLRFGCNQDFTRFEIPQTFDAAGHKRLSSFSFRDTFQKFFEPAGDIFVWGDSSWVSTGASLLNLSAIRDWLISASKNELPQWFRVLDDSLRLWLEQVRSAIISKTTARRFTPVLSLPPTTGVWADQIWLMLMAFHAATPGELAASLSSIQPSQLDPEILKTLRWVCAARQLVEVGHLEEGRDGETLIVDYQKIAWRPARPEWAAALADLFAKLQQLIDLEVMVAEWAAEAKPPMRTVLRSQIASHTGGRELTESYICARQQRFGNAYSLAEFVLKGTQSGLVRDLAFLINTIIRFKKNLPLESAPLGTHRKLEPFITGIIALVAAQKNNIINPRVARPADVLDPYILPLHQNEIALLRRAVGIPPT